MNLEERIEKIICDKLDEYGRPDLFRKPIVNFVEASDENFMILKEKIGPWHRVPSEFFPEAKSVISYFVPFTKEVAMAPASHENPAQIWGEAYVKINNIFPKINEAVEKFLIEEGFAAVSDPVTNNYDPADLKVPWSHRSVAVLAEIAKIGANNLIITSKGSCGRVSSIVTSAKLQPKEMPEVPDCLYLKNGSCGKCHEICPAHAFGKDGFDKFACQDKLETFHQYFEPIDGKQPGVCGKCLSVCPYAYIE